jgi:hypothetical protein
MREIDKAYKSEGGKKNEKDEIEGRNAVPQQEDNREDTHEELYEGITPGNGGMTRPAFSPQKDKTHQRNIVVETNGGLTVRALRRRQDDGFPLRQPMDADIKKAPNNRPKAKGEQKRYPVHPTPFPFSLSSLR